MNSYIFQTTATMKPYNNKHWYIDPDIVGEIHITAENIREAVEKYREAVKEKHYISISSNAVKNKSPMYVDTKEGETKQVGYVITGKTEFDKGDYTGWSTQYIDLWVMVLTVVDTEF